MYRPVTIYWESPEKAQSHIQPLDVSPGLLLFMLSSVISEKLDVLQILQVWSAEQVANSLEASEQEDYIFIKLIHPEMHRGFPRAQQHLCRWIGRRHSRGIGAELAAEGVAFVCRDLGLWNELSHFISHASSEVPHVTVSL